MSDEGPGVASEEEYVFGNQYVESLGGKDLLQKSDPQPVDEPVDINLDQDFDEQRRVAALQTAQTLGITNVGELLLAALQVEQFLKDGVIDYAPAVASQAAGAAQEALEGVEALPHPDAGTDA